MVKGGVGKIALFTDRLLGRLPPEESQQPVRNVELRTVDDNFKRMMSHSINYGIGIKNLALYFIFIR